LPQYKTSQTTDRRQTDDRRHIVPKARPIVRSAKNGARYRNSHKGRLIGNNISPIKWHKYQRPWVSLRSLVITTAKRVARSLCICRAPCHITQIFIIQVDYVQLAKLIRYNISLKVKNNTCIREI